MSKLRDWAGLPDGLLHSVVELLGSFPNLLAFAATCHPWRSAFSSYPSKSTLYTLFPPLHLNPDVHFCSPRFFPNVARNTFVPKRPCYVSDLASQHTLVCSQIPLLSIDCSRPPSALDESEFVFRGASFGQMIFSSNKRCFLFDVFTGIEVSPPPLPVIRNTEIYCGAALTGPLASPSSHLIIYTEYSYYFWRVGSNSWSKCYPRDCVFTDFPRSWEVTNFVVFKGQVFGMGSNFRLFMVHLTPQIHLQNIPVSLGEGNSMIKWHPTDTWLVVCGNMLLIVGCRGNFSLGGRLFEVYHLDTSTEPAKLVKVERLEKWAIFISYNLRAEALSCMNPERWGGRSNCVYCYDFLSGHLVASELGKPLLGDDATRFQGPIYVPSRCSMVRPIWVVPSMFY